MADLQQNLKDAAYIGIGFGVLTFQKAQVARRDLESQIKQRLGQRDRVIAVDPKRAGEAIETQLKAARNRLETLGDRIEDRLDPVVDQLTENLPAQARQAVTTARTRVKDARHQLLGSAA